MASCVTATCGIGTSSHASTVPGISERGVKLCDVRTAEKVVAHENGLTLSLSYHLAHCKVKLLESAKVIQTMIKYAHMFAASFFQNSGYRILTIELLDTAGYCWYV